MSTLKTMKSKEERKRLFIEKAREVHGDKYDYSEVDYVNNRTNVKIIDRNCPENPVFYQTPYNHLRGHENPFYRNERISDSKHMDWVELYQKLVASHPNENLEYPEQDVKNLHCKIRIIDHDLRPDGTEYGEYWQEANAHLKGSGHPQKAIDRNADAQRLTKDEFIRRVKEKQPKSDFDFSFVSYVNNRTKVKMYCNKLGGDGKPHGEFIAWAGNLMKGKGCPKCGHHTSRAEDELQTFFEKMGFKVETRKRLLGTVEIDIFLPEINLGIEYDGLRWHSEEFDKMKYYHYSKSEFCENNGIRLIHIFEDEWLTKKDIVLSTLKHVVGKDDKLGVGARNCKIHQITVNESSQFLDMYHLQGSCRSTIRYGAFYKEELVGVMCFKKETVEGKWELVRFCTDYNYGGIPGLAKRMLKHFVEENDVVEIKTFLDRRWNFSLIDNVYTKIGFVLDKIESPEYRYTNGHGERIHKFNFRKERLHKKYGLSLSMTEREMATSLGYYKIWDCGLIRYIYKNQD